MRNIQALFAENKLDDRKSLYEQVAAMPLRPSVLEAVASKCDDRDRDFISYILRWRETFPHTSCTTEPNPDDLNEEVPNFGARRMQDSFNWGCPAGCQVSLRQIAGALHKAANVATIAMGIERNPVRARQLLAARP